MGNPAGQLTAAPEWKGAITCSAAMVLVGFGCRRHLPKLAKEAK
jgi:hypothetical protein